MSELSEWACWQIRQCSRPDGCPASRVAGKPCWEVIGSLDYILADICSDCLVYIIKHGNAGLSSHELSEIRHARECNSCCMTVSA